MSGHTFSQYTLHWRFKGQRTNKTGTGIPSMRSESWHHTSRTAMHRMGIKVIEICREMLYVTTDNSESWHYSVESQNTFFSRRREAGARFPHLPLLLPAAGDGDHQTDLRCGSGVHHGYSPPRHQVQMDLMVCNPTTLIIPPPVNAERSPCCG